jgi:nucleotide-binding universal stress UspA family protein
MKIRTVLCPTDFSEFSRRAIEHAVAIARWNEAKLTLLHVYPFLLPRGGDAPYFPSGLPLDAATRARLLRDLETAAEPARAAGLAPELLLIEGDPSEEILRQARMRPADLIVMGTHGRRGFERWMLGSVADRVVHKAECAVLTVPRPPEGAHATPGRLYERVLCPVELSGSEAILETAFSIARSAGARLTLLHVLEDLPQHEAAARLAHLDWAGFLDGLEEDARHHLRGAAARQSAGGGQVDEMVVTGTPYREILKLANTSGASLIVMGIHGRNPLARLFLGSTTLHVLRQAGCPVLTVRGLEPGKRP